MELTLPTGTSASCTWAPLDRSPTSLKTAVAVRGGDPDPPHPAMVTAAIVTLATSHQRRRAFTASSPRHGPIAPADRARPGGSDVGRVGAGGGEPPGRSVTARRRRATPG